VDAWALTMLQPRNVGYASTCNSIGQTLGYFLAYVVFISFNSAEFCNSYVRTIPSDEGLLSLQDFLAFWGWVFVGCTLAIWLFKRERPEAASGQHARVTVGGAYKQMASIVRLPTVLSLCAVLLTAKLGTTAGDSLVHLKLLEKGMPRADMAYMSLAMLPVGLLTPMVVSRYTAGPRPLDLYLGGMLPRYLLAALSALFGTYTRIYTYICVCVCFFSCSY
jgi:PAT family acetyl-CoA transporter-like MFS transporter 1